MKIKTLIMFMLGVFAVSGVSVAQPVGTQPPKLQKSAVGEADSANPPQQKPSSDGQEVKVNFVLAPHSSKSPTMIQIYRLKYISVKEMAELIMNVLRIQAHPDERGNQLIVNATKEQMESVERLIVEVDNLNREASTPPGTQNLIYRIHMFEIPSNKGRMKPFSMKLRTSLDKFSPALLDALADEDLQICEFLNRSLGGVPSPENGDAFPDNWEREILIQGRATNESLGLFIDEIRRLPPDTHIIEVRQLEEDDEETFTNDIEAAQCAQLPERMQMHIKKLLGDDIRTVGYWFGNASVPGEVEVPIGPWMLKLRLNSGLDHTLELNVDVEMPAERHTLETQLGHRQSNKILSNMIRVKIGKPIIIGYNRESYGMRKMGAMVIIPEEDPF